MKIVMPQLGETVEEGTIAAWHKQVGDEVEKDELLLDVETDKVATEIPAPISGILTAIKVEEGETVDVGTVLAIIGDDEDDSDESPGEAETIAEADAVVADSGSGGKPAARSDDQKLSPAVRRLVAEHSLDISLIVGSGRDGRISRNDVLEFIEQGGVTAEDPASDAGNRIPFDRIRRVTAEHMVRSKATSPHVLQAIEADFSAVGQARAVHGDAWKQEHGYSLSYQAFVARAVCEALAGFPRLNSSVDGDGVLLHEKVNLAIAVDLNFEGLVAPVIGDAGSLNVVGLARAINDLVTRARGNDLNADDFSGGTYTLSNPGPFGTLFTAPIINQPQVAILSMDAIQKRAVVVETEQGDLIEVRPVGVLAHSFDHRAIDGAYSAAFLNKLKSLIETTDWVQEFQT
jgi:2-oxoglutarate dehydrogenase E2 component (dihydrolipoamide succinyltransferase)